MLLAAIVTGDVDGLERPIADGADLDWGSTPREWAEHAGSAEAAALFAARGA